MLILVIVSSRVEIVRNSALNFCIILFYEKLFKQVHPFIHIKFRCGLTCSSAPAEVMTGLFLVQVSSLRGLEVRVHLC